MSHANSAKNLLDDFDKTDWLIFAPQIFSMGNDANELFESLDFRAIRLHVHPLCYQERSGHW